MNPALVGVALAVVIGAVLAGSARNARTAILGLVVMLLAAPLLADPLAAPLGLAARLIGAVLAGYLLWIAARGRQVSTGGSLVGWPTDVSIAVAAGVVGYGSHGLGMTPEGPQLAAAAGLALAALAVLPVVNGRDILRIGLGLEMLLSAAILLRTSIGGTPDAMEQVFIGGLVATLGGAIAILAAAARADGDDDFGLSTGPIVQPESAPPVTPRQAR